MYISICQQFSVDVTKHDCFMCCEVCHKEYSTDCSCNIEVCELFAKKKKQILGCLDDIHSQAPALDLMSRELHITLEKSIQCVAYINVNCHVYCSGGLERCCEALLCSVPKRKFPFYSI